MRRDEHRPAVVDGIPMRSTLEARWATFFNCLKLKWEYEPQTFELDGGVRYTPDFCIQDMGWIEIKPTIQLLRESWRRMKLFIAERPEESVFAFCSDKVRLRKNEMLCFRRGQILVPDELQMYAILSDARNKTLQLGDGSIHSSSIATAANVANETKIDHMLSISDHFRFSSDDIIAPVNRQYRRTKQYGAA